MPAPPVRPDLVRLPLKLLADFGVGLERVAEYPRVFGHDPVTYLGPRLAYLRAYNPGEGCSARVGCVWGACPAGRWAG